MSKLTRAKVAGILLLASTAIFFVSNARATFFSPFETMVLASMTTIQTTVLQLSSDIGSMADRILVMADKIGVMADRIVHTEQMMASLVNQNGTSTLITSPTEGAYVSTYSPIQLTLSNNPQSYILYISNKADMSGSTNALVVGGNTTAAWSRVPGFATSNIVYIAVKSADGQASSDLSNTVKVILN